MTDHLWMLPLLCAVSLAAVFVVVAFALIIVEAIIDKGDRHD